MFNSINITIKYKVDHWPRPHATSCVLIKEHPDCRVVVSAPEEVDDLAVLMAVKKRGCYIYR